ncbi:O-antigen/teichoic acid export membrane protein [Scandinavium goeteborgense]|uniref:Putative O-antigen transporter n=2 Tax=Scandinavium goeteborgense TaxID=1851514 RepID=A0A4R6EBV7_SCAGO|nr:O-antigen/teichoic acid export membrane protein [Scandinavium goeteborgense]
MLAIRGATLASKFLLITFLAKYSTFELLAEYSIITVTVSYLLYILGFDFYTFSSREILKKTFKKSGGMILNQFIFYIVMYLISIPLVMLLSFHNIIDSRIIILFYFVMISEHLSQEFMRILVINSNALKANLQLFIRSASWIYIYIIYSYSTDTFSIRTLLLMWCSANFIALIYAIIELKYIDWSDHNVWQIDLSWIYSGIKVALPLLCATLMLRGIFISDRYFLKFLSTTQDLAIYSFFSNMANALIAFIDAAVIMYFYPKLINAYNSKDSAIYDHCLKLFKRKMILVGVGVSFVLALLIPLLCLYLGHIEYLQHIEIFYILLLSSFVYCYGLIFHYELYSRNEDRLILISTFISFLIGVLVQYLCGHYFYGVGMAFGVLISSSLLLISKSILISRVKRKKCEVSR